MCNRFYGNRKELRERAPIIVIIPWKFPNQMCSLLGTAMESKLNKLTQAIHDISTIINENFVRCLSQNKDISPKVEKFFRLVLLRIENQDASP